MALELSWGDWAKLVVPVIANQLYLHYKNWQKERAKKVIEEAKKISDEQTAKDYPPHAHNSHEGIRYPPGRDPRERYWWREDRR